MTTPLDAPPETRAAHAAVAALPDGGSSMRVTVRDVHGVPWSVFDAIHRESRTSRLRLGARGAPYRVFVAPDGRRRAYAFRAGESHAFAPADLERQLRDALETPD